jgi:hypothetical protein
MVETLHFQHLLLSDEADEEMISQSMEDLEDLEVEHHGMVPLE